MNIPSGSIKVNVLPWQTRDWLCAKISICFGNRQWATNAVWFRAYFVLAAAKCKLFDRSGPDGGARDYACAFFDAVGAVRLDGPQHFGRPRGPKDLHLLHLTRISQAEVKPQVALREIAAAAAHFVRL